MSAYLTGSHAYGTPRADSDVDLVVHIPLGHEAAVLLKNASHVCFDGPSSMSLMFGRLNLIVFREIDEFDKWREVTDALASKAPVTRDEAVAAFDASGIKIVSGKVTDMNQ